MVLVVSMLRRAAVLAIASLAALACADDPARSDAVSGEADASGTATITFGADPSVGPTVSGTLRGGGKVEVRYDESRLTTCRDSQGGRPLWSITGGAQVDGGAVTSFYVAGLASDPTDATKLPVITLAKGHELALWFENVSAEGCDAYDSRYGQNYRFAIDGSDEPAQPTLTFPADPGAAPTLDGSLEVGGSLVVAYDAARLATCRGSQGGRDLWTITGYARSASGKTQEFTVGGNGSFGPPVVTLDEPGSLSIWFENTSAYGCDAYDSKYGANYVYDVGP